MSDETWWRDEARRLYADCERLRQERDAAQRQASKLARQVDKLVREGLVLAERANAVRTDATRKAPVSWVAP